MSDHLEELDRRRALTGDAARPEAVARRHAAGGRTARENIADLVDDGSFIAYGRFTVAAQRQRRDLQDHIARTPADGLIGMGLEGAVRLGLRKELEAIADEAEREEVVRRATAAAQVRRHLVAPTA